MLNFEARIPEPLWIGCILSIIKLKNYSMLPAISDSRRIIVRKDSLVVDQDAKADERRFSLSYSPGAQFGEQELFAFNRTQSLPEGD